MLNFPDTRFSDSPIISVIKKTLMPVIINLDFADNLAQLKDWFRVEVDWFNCMSDDITLFNKIKKCWLNASPECKNFDWDSWNPSESYLPLTNISNHLVDNNWEDFRKSLREQPKEKKTRISEIGRQVAIINGYLYDLHISNINKTSNSLREIYVAGKNKVRFIYRLILKREALRYVTQEVFIWESFGLMGLRRISLIVPVNIT
ncbi:MAG: hypothetical protein HC880_21400 [Bacteroidia bacterium]|nr:hypothetical protein [Bacteroidia bacterium]